jgi:hypothetical protein
LQAAEVREARAPGVSSFLPAEGRGGYRPSPLAWSGGGLTPRLPYFVDGGGGEKGLQPLAPCSLFMWGNVWYVWHLGVYFPGCLWVRGVEMWGLEGFCGSGWWL